MSSAPVSWQQGSHVDLLACIRARRLDPAQPARWCWDPRPQRKQTPAPRDRSGSHPAPCPFLVSFVPVFEGHAEWDTDGALLRLLVTPGSGDDLLRWAWHVRPLDKMAPIRDR